MKNVLFGLLLFPLLSFAATDSFSQEGNQDSKCQTHLSDLREDFLAISEQATYTATFLRDTGAWVIQVGNTLENAVLSDTRLTLGVTGELNRSGRLAKEDGSSSLRKINPLKRSINENLIRLEYCITQ